MTVNAAAWVPYDSRDWSAVAADAVEWVEARCAEDGASGVLVQPTLGDRHVWPLTRFGQRHAVTSRRAGRDRVGPGRGPVLVYVPDADDLEFAMRLARGSAIAAVESGSFALRGWAARLGATNLATGEPTPPLPDDLVQAVDDLKFDSNNAFGDVFGKQQARRRLAVLERNREVDDTLLTALLAAGVSADGVKNLARLMGRRRLQ